MTLPQPIRLIERGLDVAPLLAEIDAHPEAWNRYTARTAIRYGPHAQVSDIWVRYNDIANFTGDLAAFNAPHEAVWYPVAQQIPSVVTLVNEVVRRVAGKRLGGVLITRIPPGGRVEPHVDRGWHAEFYEKFAVQLRGNAQQAFCFEDAELRPEPGDLYTFDNSRLHWVVNDSAEERMTLIICIKR